MTCRIEGCERPLGRGGAARGLCIAHYHRLLRYGDPTFIPERKVRPVSDRFWEKVEKTDGCWIWSAATNRGWGIFNRGSGNVPAHRMAYEFLVGPIPDGLELDHLCRVRRCVNPAHLEPVTRAEHNRRTGAVKTHCPKGHPYDEMNTLIESDGHRRCRTCLRAANKAYDASRSSKNR